MLRITKMANDPSTVTLKLEGTLSSDWVTLLENECLSCLNDNREVLLDFSDVTFVDDHGVQVLKKLASKQFKIVSCSEFVTHLLKRGEKND